MVGQIAMYLLSGFVIIIGGISLFIQKVYRLDGDKGTATVVELPFFGKLTTNYPALAFVFIGAAMAIYTLGRTSEVGSEDWVITGKFTAPTSESVQWDGTVSVSPRRFETTDIRGSGDFELQGSIRKGEAFEDVVKQITYTSKSCLAKILVDEEYEKYKNGQPTCLQAAKGTTRRYGSVEVTMVPQ
jgi:hypothetical protein